MISDSHLKNPIDDIGTKITKLYTPKNRKSQPFYFAIEQFLYTLLEDRENELALVGKLTNVSS